MLAAAREKKISALVLIAAPGTLGADLVLEQQRHLLDEMKAPEAERQAKIELQQRIHAAVIADKGWEAIPPELRAQADSTWFRSLLAVRSGEADAEGQAAHADRPRRSRHAGAAAPRR